MSLLFTVSASTQSLRGTLSGKRGRSPGIFMAMFSNLKREEEKGKKREKVGKIGGKILRFFLAFL